MAYNIGDPITVNIGNKQFYGLILNVKKDYITVIYVGKTEEKTAFAITDNFDMNGNLLNS